MKVTMIFFSMDFQFLEKAPVLETLSGQQSEDLCISLWTSSSNVKLDSLY